MAVLELPKTTTAPATEARRRWQRLLLAFATFALVSYALFAADQELRQPSHPVPDGYATLALHWHSVLAAPGPESLSAARDFASSYYQTSNWLTAFLAALVMFLTGTTLSGQLLAFAIVSFLASATTGVFLYRYLRDRLGLSARGSATCLLIFWGNLIVMGSILRPMTDAVVLATFAAGLYVLTGPRRGVALTVLCIGVMAKVSFATLLLAPLAMWLARRALLAPAARTAPRADSLAFALACFGLPAFVWVVVLGAGGALSTVDAQAETLGQFRAYRGIGTFSIALLLAGQALWLLAGGRATRERWREPALQLPAVWLLGSVAMLVVGGVPFLNRHFLPITLALTILSAPTLDRWSRPGTGWTRHLPILFIGSNVVVAAYMALLPSALGHYLPVVPFLSRLAYG